MSRGVAGRASAFAALLGSLSPALCPAQSEAPDTWGSGAETLEAPGANPEGGVDGAPPVESLPEPPPVESLPDPQRGAPVRYVLERVEVRGNRRTRPRVLLRYLPFRAGDVIDVDDLDVELARHRLLATGFFREVQFSLRKGSRRGAVVLVVEVAERNTVIVNDLWMGLSADADARGSAKPLTAYGGIDVSESNLVGTGMTLGGAVGVARDQLALRVRFFDPAFLGTRWMVAGSLLYNDALDFFGASRVGYYGAGPSASREVTDFAVVDYTRFGGAIGIGRDLSLPTQLWFHHRLERIDAAVPLAWHDRGDGVEPIEIDLSPGKSNLSLLRVQLQHDTRDHPFLPEQGWLLLATADLSSPALASDYDYFRADANLSRWWRLPWSKHVLRLEAFVGAISGDAPFFEQYFVGDFSDFLPDRMLGLNVDRRPSPNFLGTVVGEVRYGEYAAKAGVEYRIPLYRGQRSVFGLDLFGSGGAFALASDREFTDRRGGRRGLALFPVDLTANLGVRMDTSAGGFAFTFSNVLGFIPVRGESGR